MKAWQTMTVTAVLCVIAFSLLIMAMIQNKAQAEQAQEPPEEIKIYRYYNESSQVECFYHKNAISCLWVMDGGK